MNTVGLPDPGLTGAAVAGFLAGSAFAVEFNTLGPRFSDCRRRLPVLGIAIALRFSGLRESAVGDDGCRDGLRAREGGGGGGGGRGVWRGSLVAGASASKRDESLVRVEPGLSGQRLLLPDGGPRLLYSLCLFS